MKKFIKILVVFAIFGVIGLAVMAVRKKKKESKDREILNGMTGSEFLDRIRPAWESKFKTAQESWLRDQPEYDRSFNGSFQEYKYNIGGDPVPQKSQSQIDAEIDKLVKGSAEGSWNELSPNPNDYDWARLYWLPTEIDRMGLNINHDRVRELIAKI